ncbi:MAG: DNA/RNA non-specific endonuclease, partial [Sphaerochaeta sp.]
MGRRTNKAKKRGKRILILLIVLIVLWALTLILAPGEEEYVQTSTGSIPDLEVPAYSATDIVVTHPGYTLLYDEEHEQASWVAYELTRSELYGMYERGDD